MATKATANGTTIKVSTKAIKVNSQLTKLATMSYRHVLAVLLTLIGREAGYLDRIKETISGAGDGSKWTAHSENIFHQITDIATAYHEGMTVQKSLSNRKAAALVTTFGNILFPYLGSVGIRLFVTPDQLWRVVQRALIGAKVGKPSASTVLSAAVSDAKHNVKTAVLLADNGEKDLAAKFAGNAVKILSNLEYDPKMSEVLTDAIMLSGLASNFGNDELDTIAKDAKAAVHLRAAKRLEQAANLLKESGFTVLVPKAAQKLRAAEGTDVG